MTLFILFSFKIKCGYREKRNSRLTLLILSTVKITSLEDIKIQFGSMLHMRRGRRGNRLVKEMLPHLENHDRQSQTNLPYNQPTDQPPPTDGHEES